MRFQDLNDDCLNAIFDELEDDKNSLLNLAVLNRRSHIGTALLVLKHSLVILQLSCRILGAGLGPGGSGFDRSRLDLSEFVHLRVIETCPAFFMTALKGDFDHGLKNFDDVGRRLPNGLLLLQVSLNAI